MSAVVQLSFGIKENLHLDDHPFQSFEAHHKAETKNKNYSISNSFAPQQDPEEWAATRIGSSLLATSAVTSPTSNNSTDILSGASGAVVGIPLRKFENQKPFSLRDIKPIALVKTTVPQNDHSQTTVFDLKQQKFSKLKEKTFLPFDTSRLEKDPITCNRQRLIVAENSTLRAFSAINEIREANSFPSVSGESSIEISKNLNYNVPTLSAFVGVPPIKKHCRSKPSDCGGVAKHVLLPRSWKPNAHSRVWVSVHQHQPCNNTEPMAGMFSRQPYTNFSKSTDSGSLTRSKFSTSSISSIPRPASVTVIKQEGITHTLPSQHQISGHVRNFNFSPLESSVTEVSSDRLPEVGSKSWHSGSTATKRSLSFSEDFDYKESIEYSPTTTPELERRFDQNFAHEKLLRCESHPSDINLKRGKSKRKARLCYNRPSLDLFKMKQTKYNAYNKCKGRNSSGIKTKLHPLPPLTSPSASFTIGCSSESLHGGQDPVHPATCFVPALTEDHAVSDLHTIAATRVVTSFVRDCYDLDVDEIEKESDTEMNAQ